MKIEMERMKRRKKRMKMEVVIEMMMMMTMKKRMKMRYVALIRPPSILLTIRFLICAQREIEHNPQFNQPLEPLLIISDEDDNQHNQVR